MLNETLLVDGGVRTESQKPDCRACLLSIVPEAHPSLLAI